MSRVLLVDDDRDGLEIRKRILESRGHQVVAASEASRARDEFQAAAPEMVILDLRVPEPEQGLALIREFRAASKSFKLIVLCGCPADLDGRPERELVDLILSKPVRSEALLSAVQ